MFPELSNTVDKVTVKNDKLAAFTAKAYMMLSHKRQHKRRESVLLSSTTDSIYLSSLVAVALKLVLLLNVVGLPLSISPFHEKKCLFK
jgi:electron transfer flavoprotein alpha subunit